MKLNNKYYILRHGEAMSNVKQVCSSWPERFKNPLTKYGKETIMAAAEILKENHAKHGRAIDVIVASPLLRAKQTAQIVGKELNVRPKFDTRLKEIGFGSLNGHSVRDLDVMFNNESERVKKVMSRGETYVQVLARAYEFLKEIDKKQKGKNILIVSHEGPLWMLEAKLHGMSLPKALKAIPRDHRIHKGQIKELN